MEIHPLSGPTHSLKDFGVHILIVTVGILIAFSFEGAREVWREHKAIAEARAGFQRELRVDREHLASEMASVTSMNAQIEEALKMVANTAETAETLTKQVANFAPGFYFFKTTAWKSAIAEGVMTHMDEEEVNRFEDAYPGVKNYQDAQEAAIPEWISVVAWFRSHHMLTPADRVTGEEKLLLLQARTVSMEHLGGELSAGLQGAIGN